METMKQQHLLHFDSSKVVSRENSEKDFKNIMNTIRNSLTEIDDIKTMFEQDHQIFVPSNNRQRSHSRPSRHHRLPLHPHYPLVRSMSDRPSFSSSSTEASTSLSNSFMSQNSEDDFDIETIRKSKLQIIYYNELPHSYYLTVIRHLRQNITSRNRFIKLKKYKCCFDGKQVSDLLTANGFCHNVDHAVKIGQVLVQLGYIQLLTISKRNKSEENNTFEISQSSLYCFTQKTNFFVADKKIERSSSARLSITAINFRESLLSTRIKSYPLQNASDEAFGLTDNKTLTLISRALQRSLEKKNKLLFYEGKLGCFIGAEAVAALQYARITENSIDSILICQAMIENGLIEAHKKISKFQDGYVLYRLTKLNFNA